MKRLTPLFLTVLLVGLAGKAQAVLPYDFEGGAQGWDRDVSHFYNDNFTASPAVSSVKAHKGTKSLAATLNFTEQAYDSGSARYYGVKDALKANPPGAENLSGSLGVVAYVYLASSANNGNPFYPLMGRFYIKTGPGWEGYRSADTPIFPGQWTRLKLTFSSCFLYSDGSPAVVANSGDVREFGLDIYGATYDRGVTTLYMDNIRSFPGDDVDAPSAPAEFSASDARTGNQVTLSWTANLPADMVDHYNIYRSTFSGVLAAKSFVKSVPGASAADDSVVDGVNYFYQVTAVDISGNESGGSDQTSASPSGPAGYDKPMKGMTYAAWQDDIYGLSKSKSSLDDLRATGADYVALIVTQYVPGITGSSVDPSLDQTASNASLITAIQDIHARGMKVLLKPHVDINGGTWRGDFYPADLDAWVNSYIAFITGYAQMAMTHGVELFCVGTEFKRLTDHAREPNGESGILLTKWTQIINAVKAVYPSGPTRKLVYAANSNYPQDEFSQVQFWDQLDYVGLNAYFPLTGWDNPTVDELKKAWSNNREGKNPLEIAAAWRKHTGKPVILTELGYRSFDGANKAPHDFVSIGSPNNTEQDRCYQAAFAAWNHRPWMEGIFWWHWDPYLQSGAETSVRTYYTPMDKPASATIKANYGGEPERPVYTFASGIQGWTFDTTGDFLDILGAPSTSLQGGSAALDYPLNLNSAVHTGGQQIRDFGFVLPAISKDWSGYTGLKAYVMLDPGASVGNDDPLKCALTIQSSSTLKWFQSNSFRSLTPGVWREISMDFGHAESFDPGAVGPVQFLEDVRRIGFVFAGAGSSNGSTRFYVDNVAARGGVGFLGFSLSTGSYSFGSVVEGHWSAAQYSIDIENTGNVPLRYLLNCSKSTPANWVPASVPFVGRFVLNAQFNSALPADFVELKHVLSLLPTPSDAVKFAGNQTGELVPIDGVRNLWLEFRAPAISNAGDMVPQSITMDLTAEMD